jgi:hypothetical protein
MPEQYKPGQQIIAKIIGISRETKVRDVLDSTEGVKLIVDFGFSQTARIHERDVVPNKQLRYDAAQICTRPEIDLHPGFFLLSKLAFVHLSIFPTDSVLSVSTGCRFGNEHSFGALNKLIRFAGAVFRAWPIPATGTVFHFIPLDESAFGPPNPIKRRLEILATKVVEFADYPFVETRKL